jgi:cysteinyl-tRNA synthetase
MHNGLLTINGEKMAKSIGNFISVKEILGRYHPEVLKIFFLSGHYRSPVDFTEEKMEEAKRARERFYILFDRIGRSKGVFGRLRRRPRPGAKEREEVDGMKAKFKDAMDDDFNTPLALGHMYELLSLTNKMLDAGAARRRAAPYAKGALLTMGGVFGLFLDKSEFRKRSSAGEGIENAIRERNEARGRGDYARADEIRDRLSREGIVLEDTKEGTTWRRRV